VATYAALWRLRMQKRTLSLVLLVGVLALLVSGVSLAAAQSNVVITLAAPQNLRPLLETGAIAEFEAANPGVDVVVEYVQNVSTSPVGDISGYLEDMQAFVAQGDVLYVGANSIAPEATRAGLFLDL